jgi:carbon monoxide dehydrogenase subunit G
MKFENSFDVHAPVQDVWTALMDIERVAPCMPGAEVLETLGDDAYKVGVKLKLGPISMLYRGQVEIVERDDSARQATMRARAKEARGQGTADARVHMSLAEQTEGTHATIETEMQLSGRAAAMGQGVIGDVAEKLIEEFAGNLASMLRAGTNGAAPTVEDQPTVAPASPPGPAPSTLPAGRIAGEVIAARLANPRTLAVLAVVCAAVGYLIGRRR